MVFLLAKHQGAVLFSTLLLFLLMDISSALSPDGEALLSFKTGIVSSDVLLQWRQEDPDPCGWKGVTCDNRTKRVIHLGLIFLIIWCLNVDAESPNKTENDKKNLTTKTEQPKRAASNPATYYFSSF